MNNHIDFENKLQFSDANIPPLVPSVQILQLNLSNLMFFWPCIMNWLYINYQLDALIIIYS